MAPDIVAGNGVSLGPTAEDRGLPLVLCQGVEDLTLGGDDDDYFAIELESGDTLNATLTHRESAGDVALTVIEPDGNVTHATDRSGLSGHEKKRAEFTAQKRGTHYVWVSGSTRTALTYNLTIGTDKASSATSPGLGLAAALLALLVVAFTALRRA